MPERRSQRGFTLIEVMVVVAMIAIISTIAISSFQSATTKSNRAAAIQLILEVANREERFLLDNRSYAIDPADPNDPGALSQLGLVDSYVNSNYPNVLSNYAFTVTEPGGVAYLVTATPQGTQATSDTKCGTLTLSSTGAKTESGTGTVQECWR